MEGMKNKTVGRRLLLYTMVIMAILLPLGISAVHLATNQDVEIEIENKHVETLIVRIAYSPELATYIGSWGSGEAREGFIAENVGGFFRIEWLMKNGEVKINVANETMHVLKVDDLKKKVELLNLTVKGLCVNVTTVILNMPYLLSPVYEPPDAVKHDALLLLENQSFIKWLKEEGFTYTGGRISSLSGRGVFDFDKITGVTVELAVDNLTLLHHLYFDKPYVLVANISIPAGLKESPYELENFGVCMIMIFMHSSGSGVYFYRFPPKYQKITGPEYPFVSKRLTFDIMSETGQKVMKILKDNGLTRRLMESFQCEVREIVRWMLSDGVIDSTAVVTLVCEEKGYEFSVRIDLNAERIKEIYCYPLQK